MHRKTREELWQQLHQLRFEAKTLTEHLNELESAIEGETPASWHTIWMAVHHQSADLRRLVPGVVALGRRMVRLAVADKVARSRPGELADLTRSLLTRYLNIHGGAYEALYAQLNRGAELGSLNSEDPELLDLAERMTPELQALQERARPEAALLVEAIEVSAAVLMLLCNDNDQTRGTVAMALSGMLERHIEDSSTALEFLIGG